MVGHKNRLFLINLKRNSGTIMSNEFMILNVGPNLASKIQSTGKHYYDYLSTAHKQSIFMRPIVEDEILKIINKFDKNKSTGHDGIGNLID